MPLPDRSEPYSVEGRCPVSSFEFLSSLRNQFAPERAYPSAKLSQRHPLPDQIREQAEKRAPGHEHGQPHARLEAGARTSGDNGLRVLRPPPEIGRAHV